jgi:hypothetical protein
MLFTPPPLNGGFRLPFSSDQLIFITLYICFVVPRPPLNLRIGFRAAKKFSIATVSFSSPLGSHEGVRPKHYEYSVEPQPVMQPSTKVISSPFDVTVNHYRLYTITVFSVSCGGRSSLSESFYLGNLRTWIGNTPIDLSQFA